MIDLSDMTIQSPYQRPPNEDKKRLTIEQLQSIMMSLKEARQFAGHALDLAERGDLVGVQDETTQMMNELQTTIALANELMNM